MEFKVRENLKNAPLNKKQRGARKKKEEGKKEEKTSVCKVNNVPFVFRC